MPHKTPLIVAAILLSSTVAALLLIVSSSENARWRSVEKRFKGIKDIPVPSDTAPAKSQSDNRIPASKTSKPLLRFAIAPVISPEDAYVSYKRLVENLASTLGREGRVIMRSSYAEINDLVRDEECDVAFVCTYSYVIARNEFGARLLAVPVVEGRKSYQSYMVVPSTSNAENIMDLKNQTFGYADDISTSGWLYPAVFLQDRGHDPMRFFKKRIRMGRHDKAVMATAYGELESAAVDSIVYDHMPTDIKSRLKVIHRSPRFGMPPFITPAGLDEKFRERLLDRMLSLHQSHKGKEILKALKIDKFAPTENEMYESVEDLVAKWEK